MLDTDLEGSCCGLFEVTNPVLSRKLGNTTKTSVMAAVNSTGIRTGRRPHSNVDSYD